MSTVRLHRRNADSDIRSDLLVETTRQHQFKHLAFALRQPAEVRSSFRDGVFVVAVGTVLTDRQLDRVQQLLITDRLGEELNRSGLHGPNRHRDIRVAADENNRQVNIRLDEAIVKLQSTPPRQSDVENEASQDARARGGEKFLNRGEQLDAQAYRSQQPLKGVTDIPIVIDNDNGRLSIVTRRWQSKPFLLLPAM